jgi:hypothetical protein
MVLEADASWRRKSTPDDSEQEFGFKHRTLNRLSSAWKSIIRQLPAKATYAQEHMMERFKAANTSKFISTPP